MMNRRSTRQPEAPVVSVKQEFRVGPEIIARGSERPGRYGHSDRRAAWARQRGISLKALSLSDHKIQDAKTARLNGPARNVPPDVDQPTGAQGPRSTRRSPICGRSRALQRRRMLRAFS